MCNASRALYLDPNMFLVLAVLVWGVFSGVFVIGGAGFAGFHLVDRLMNMDILLELLVISVVVA
mgnify:CR=1 FL=1